MKLDTRIRKNLPYRVVSMQEIAKQGDWDDHVWNQDAKNYKAKHYWCVRSQKQVKKESCFHEDRPKWGPNLDDFGFGLLPNHLK